MLLDLGNVLVNLWKFWKQDKEWQAWIRLILSLNISAFLGLTGTWGGALMLGKPPWIAFGAGLCGCATAVLGVVVNSPEARSLLVSTPQSVVKDYQDSGNATFYPTDKK